MTAAHALVEDPAVQRPPLLPAKSPTATSPTARSADPHLRLPTGRLALGALALAGVALGAGAAGAQLSEVQKATTLAKPAVVYVKAEQWSHVAYGGKLYGPVYTGAVGSGFLVHPDGFVITNAHVLEPDARTAQSIKVNFALLVLQELGRAPSEAEVGKIAANAVLVEPDEGLPIKPSEIQRQAYVVLKGGLSQVKELQRELKAEVRALSPMLQKDIAILKVSGSNFPTVVLGDSNQVQLQDSITVVGYPGVVQSTFERTGLFGADSQMEVSVTQGIISSFKTWHDGSQILGTDAGAAHGNSGGPALNARGEVIGILSMGAVSDSGGNYPFNFLRPIAVAQDFVRASGIVPEESLTTRRYAAGLASFWAAQQAAGAGDKSRARDGYRKAKEELQGALALYPQHPDAQGYLVRTEEALSQLPGGLAIPWLPVLIGLAVVALLALALVVLRGKRPSAPPIASLAPLPVLQHPAPQHPAAQHPAAQHPALQHPAAQPQPAQPHAPSPQGAPGPAARQFSLEAESGPLAGNRYEVGPGGLTIGRDPAKCQVVYQADTVSREHARLQITGDGLIVTNLSATNQTYVNDQAISQAPVRAGDRVRVSQVVFLVRG